MAHRLRTATTTATRTTTTGVLMPREATRECDAVHYERFAMKLTCLLIGICLMSCSGAKQRAANGASAALDCAAPALAGVVAELTPLAVAAVKSLVGSAGEVDLAGLKAAARGLRGDAYRCALAAAVAVLAPVAPAAPDEAVSALSAPGGLRDAYAAVRVDLGWPRARLADGSVL